MYKVMKKVLPILLMIWPYVFLAIFWMPSAESEAFFGLIMKVGIFLTGVVVVFNIMNAFTYRGMYADYELAYWNMLIKLVHIPFYLLIFVLGIVLLAASVVPALIFVTPILIVCLMAGTFCLMITTSIYGINALARAVKMREISVAYAVVHGILHCIFVTDTISAVIIFFKLRKKSKEKVPGYVWS